MPMYQCANDDRTLGFLLCGYRPHLPHIQLKWCIGETAYGNTGNLLLSIHQVDTVKLTQ